MNTDDITKPLEDDAPATAPLLRELLADVRTLLARRADDDAFQAEMLRRLDRIEGEQRERAARDDAFQAAVLQRLTNIEHEQRLMAKQFERANKAASEQYARLDLLEDDIRRLQQAA